MTIRPFTPAQEAPEVLERRTVGRDSLLAVLARRLREAATSATRQHTLLVGPRGSGKTHLLRVVEHQVGRDPAVAGRLLFARVPEDVVGVTSYAALLRQLCISARADPGRERDPAALERLLLDRAGERTVVIVIENLDRVFRSIGLDGQRDLRSWVETSGRVLLLTATPALFDAVKERDKPWFAGLIVTPVEGLSAEDGRDLLIRLALDRDDQALAALLQSDRGQARVRAVSRLTAGSARIWMVLSECLTVENLTELIPAIEALVESLVPYYQSLLWDLPDNHQAIVQQLAEGVSAAMTAKELGAETGLSEQTVSKALSLLQEGRWVRGEKLRSGDQRQTWYRLREPMLRHHFQWRATQGEPLRLIVELLREWYAVGELRRHLASVEPASPGAGYLAESLRLSPPAYDLAINAADPVTVRAVAREWMRGDDDIYPAECGLWVELCLDLDLDPTADVVATANRWRQRYHDLPAVDAPMLADLAAAASVHPGLAALVRAAATRRSGGVRTGLCLVAAGLGGRARPDASRDLLAGLDVDARSPLGLAVLVERAFWTAQSGDPAAALDTVAGLLPALTEVLGADHTVTLRARSNLAGYTGRVGDAATALRLYQAVAGDSERVLGPDDRDTLTARAQVAYYTGRVGDAATALRLCQAVAADCERVLGPDDRDTLTARHQVAYYTGRVGDAATALRLYQAVAGDSERVLGPDDRDTLTARHQVAYYTGRVGDAATALRLYQAVAADCERVLGPDDRDTLTARAQVAYYTGEVGDAATALRLYQAVAADCDRVLGPDDRDTLTARHQVAYYTGRVGDAATALRLSQAVAADRDRVLGPDDRDTLTARHQVAYYTGRVGDAATALRLYQAVAADRDRVLGPDDRDTLTARHQVAYYTGRVGDAATALRLYQALAADCDRVLGPDDELTRSAHAGVARLSPPSNSEGRLSRLLKRARGGDEVSRMRLPAELRPLVDDARDS